MSHGDQRATQIANWLKTAQGDALRAVAYAIQKLEATGDLENFVTEQIDDTSPSPLPCLCGATPRVNYAWGRVECMNPVCPARPSVDDGHSVAEDNVNDRYLAVSRWNAWIRGEV